MRNGIARVLMIALLWSIASGRVQAHDEWVNHQEVDPVTKSLCCDGSDTKIADDIVKSAVGGVSFTDRPGEIIPFARIQPSPDGHWWRSVWGGEVRCVFGPMDF
jgi:hypothetical protein